MPADLHYLACERPLPQCAGDVSRFIKAHRIRYVIVDSVAYACGGSPEASDIATDYKRHVQTWGVGSLHLAHVTKAGSTEFPFGSAFWHNGARSTWYVDATKGRTERAPDGQIVYQETDLTLHHRKSNTGPLEEHPRHVRMIVDDREGRIRLVSGAVSETRTLPSSISVPEQIRRALLAGPLSREGMGAALPAVSRDTLQRTLRRAIKEGWLHEGASGLSVIPAGSQGLSVAA
jgi:hypothetical protein